MALTLSNDEKNPWIEKGRKNQATIVRTSAGFSSQPDKDTRVTIYWVLILYVCIMQCIICMQKMQQSKNIYAPSLFPGLLLVNCKVSCGSIKPYGRLWKTCILHGLTIIIPLLTILSKKSIIFWKIGHLKKTLSKLPLEGLEIVYMSRTWCPRRQPKEFTLNGAFDKVSWKSPNLKTIPNIFFKIGF